MVDYYHTENIKYRKPYKEFPWYYETKLFQWVMLKYYGIKYKRKEYQNYDQKFVEIPWFWRTKLGQYIVNRVWNWWLILEEYRLPK